MARRRSRADRGATRPRSTHVVHGFGSPAGLETQGVLTLVKGKGVHVWDEHGRKYLDGLAGLWNVAVGYGRTEIAGAIAAQARTLSYAPTLLGFSSVPAQRLAARIVKMAPKGLTRVLFTSGGSDANETVIRLVRLYWRLRKRADKVKLVALNRAYHGTTTGAASLTGLPYFHQHYEPLMPGVERMPRPFCHRCELGLRYPACALACADELERIVERDGADTIGAFIAEPVQGVGGVIVPPADYFQRIRAICDRHDILMVVDEVITGFGRLGTRFGIERWHVTPDLLVFAKAVTSGYQPLGGVIMREEIYRTLIDAGPGFTLHHGFTYSGHPVACVAALANLDIMEREGLIGRARRLAPYFARQLASLARHPIVGEVRAVGLMAALEIVRDRESGAPFPADLAVPAQVRRAALEKGVIVRASADTVVLCPPLIITRTQIDQLVRALDASLAAVTETLTRAGAFEAAPASAGAQAARADADADASLGPLDSPEGC